MHRAAARRGHSSLAQDLYTAPIILCAFGASCSAAVIAAADHPLLFAGLILCELWSPAEAPRDALSFVYGQAAVFSSPRQAAAFFSASCWVRGGRCALAAMRCDVGTGSC